MTNPYCPFVFATPFFPLLTLGFVQMLDARMDEWPKVIVPDQICHSRLWHRTIQMTMRIRNRGRARDHGRIPEKPTHEVEGWESRRKRDKNIEEPRSTEIDISCGLSVEIG